MVIHAIVETTAEPLTAWEDPSADYIAEPDAECDSCDAPLDRDAIYWRRVEVRSCGVFDEMRPFCFECDPERSR